MFVMRALRSVSLSGIAVLFGHGVLVQAQTPATASRIRQLKLNQTQYELRAGGHIAIDAALETVDFVRRATNRKVRVITGEVNARFAFGPAKTGEQLILAASLRAKPGTYTVALSAVANDGQQGTATAEVVLDPVETIPSSSTVPPVVLLNGWQFPTSLTEWLTSGTCPPSIPSRTFGSLETQLKASQSASVGTPVNNSIRGAGVPVVYFFDNCVEAPNALIENLGAALGQVLNLIRYDDGRLVPQVDVVAHSMGGLIVRAYLSGLQTNGTFSPPANPRVRKFVEIATPNFGSFLSANNSLLTQLGTQSAEMIPGSPFLWNLATWNQRGDDVRGVDGLAIVGNAGYWQPHDLSLTPSPKLSDGVVSITSASLGFVPLSYARNPSRTRVLNYCHSDSSSGAGSFIDCNGQGGIANVDQAPETAAIVLSFLENTSDWQSIGSSNQTQYGGLYFALDNTAGTQYTALKGVSLGSQPFQPGGSPDIFFAEFVDGTGTLLATSTTGQATSCGSFSAPGGYYFAVRCKFSPSINSVQSNLPSVVPGLTLTSGSTITISGSGFGAQQCATCGVTASNPQSTALRVSSWSDTSIQAFLPATITGIATIGVTTASGFDAINIMAAAPASSSSIAVAPSSLQFAYTVGGSIPAAQSIQITSSGGTLNWTATSSAAWLSVAPISGTTPSTVSLSLSPSGLSAGTYTGNVQISASGASNSPVSVAVTLVVSGGATGTPVLAVSLQGLTFKYTVGGANPAAQNISITNAGGGTLSWTASANASWVGLSSTFGTAPSTLSVSVNPASMGAATYAATVSIRQVGTTGTVLPVSITLMIQSPQPTVNITAVVNGASFQSGFASATWVSILGTNFSQTTRMWGDGDFVNGLLPTSLDGLSVTINGIPAYVEYISSTQVNVLSPDDGTVAAVPVQVTTPQGTSNTFMTQKGQFAPAFFTGGGYVVALHSDYTPIGNSGGGTPAQPGETILIYGTGFGSTNPPVSSAQLVTTPADLANTVQVTIGGQVAAVGSAGLVGAGLYQFNVTVPYVPNGDAPVLAQIGGAQTQTGVSITIQQ